MNLPNPFLSSAVEPSAEESTVASPVPSRSDDAAVDNRFVLDVDAFIAELDEPPLFLQQRFPDLHANELIDMLAAMAGHYGH